MDFLYLFLTAIALFAAAAALMPLIKRLKKAEARKRPERQGASDDGWEDIPFNKSPHNGWAIMPRSHNSKLVTIRIMADQQEARDNIVRAVLQGEDVVLGARRDPQNRFDNSAIAIFRIIDSGEPVQAGYVDAETAKALALRYRPEMPITAEIRSVRSNGEQVYIGINLLVPTKNTRGSFEIS